MNKKDRLSSYLDMTEQLHRSALEVAFSDNTSFGYQALLDALKRDMTASVTPEEEIPWSICVSS